VYRFERAEILLNGGKIDIYDEHTFCRYVLAHNYLVNLQTNPKGYVLECIQTNVAYLESLEESKKKAEDPMNRIRIPNLLEDPRVRIRISNLLSHR
jgi:hypothetical protein